MPNALQQLHAMTWLPASSSALAASLLDWLMESGSMTLRLKQHCQQISVQIQCEGFITANEVNDMSLLPPEEKYWLREVLLYGDGVPWLAARTLIPQSSLSGAEHRLKKLGTRPLGHYLFSAANFTRDFIEPGHVDGLWGRRSRLRLSGKPLLLTELFLPHAPLYRALCAEGKL